MKGIKTKTIYLLYYLIPWITFLLLLGLYLLDSYFKFSLQFQKLMGTTIFWTLYEVITNILMLTGIIAFIVLIIYNKKHRFIKKRITYYILFFTQIINIVVMFYAFVFSFVMIFGFPPQQ